MDYIPFEQPLAELEMRIEELRRMSVTQAINLNSEISDLEALAIQLRDTMFAKLTAYEITQLSRHPKRPTTKDILGLICPSFIELHGDRNFFDDPAIIGGIGKISGQSMVLIGHQKGRGTKDNIARNFGMPKPEGYRKALRLMSLAERLSLPIITFIDTPGAYPGIDAEERGQSEAIGKNIMVMAKLKVPVIFIVLGEGGSGGALALGVGNKVHMMQYSIYSVISPEGCASILLKDSTKASSMAESLKLTSGSALELGVIDSIIPEAPGGAHRDPEFVAEKIKENILEYLNVLLKLSGDELKEHRINKFLNMVSIHETI
jgi:acetyl-CoA carboxylase carboxyl transferase subunit alpha